MNKHTSKKVHPFSYNISNNANNGNETTNRIIFADAEVERICVENFSSNGLYLTYEDAEKVTSLNYLFQGNNKIVYFDELKYFTGIKVINTKEFENCVNLKTLSFSKNISGLNDGCLNKCQSIEKITIYSYNLPRLGSHNENPTPYYAGAYGYIYPFNHVMVGTYVNLYIPKNANCSYANAVYGYKEAIIHEIENLF